MGCFFACFRFSSHGHRDDGVVLPQSSTPTATVSKNNLSSMFMHEDANTSMDYASAENGVDMELKDEAKLLKACGALLETPEEFRKASQKISGQNQTKELPESHTLFPDASIKKFHWDEQTDQAFTSHLPTNVDSDFPACQSDRKISGKECNITLSSFMNEVPDVEPQSICKSDQFESFQKDARYQAVIDNSVHDISTPNFGYKKQMLESKQFPCPTPLKLTDEMETPGTVYAVNQVNIGTLKNRHVRSQHVYPIINPVSLSHQNISCSPGISKDPSEQQIKGDSTSKQQLDVSSPNGERSNCGIISADDLVSFSTPGGFPAKGSLDAPSSGNKDQEQQTPDITMPSLSQWLKPPIPEDERRRITEASMDLSPSSKSSEVDRPIIGMVAAHWNDEDSIHISTKWWDGNGIPNSTHKYKEDQKVNWHATPFEERLEKALSNDSQLLRWNKTSKLIKFGEQNEDCDTATSQVDLPTGLSKDCQSIIHTYQSGST